MGWINFCRGGRGQGDRLGICSGFVGDFGFVRPSEGVNENESGSKRRYSGLG